MGEPLVLLPGLMCDARLFGPQIAAFSSGRAVMVGEISRDASAPAIAARVLAEAPPHFALAGLSMGGIIAMEMAAQAPDRITRLALLDTNPKAEAPDVAARRPLQIERVRAGGLAEIMRDELKPNYLAEGSDRKSILNLCLEMALSLGPEAFARQSTALMGRPDQQERLRRIEQPALALCGAEDALCPPSRHELIRDLMPNCALEVVEGAGHLPTLEQPAATNVALARWLAA